MISISFRCDCGGNIKYDWRLKARKCKKCGKIIKMKLRPLFRRDYWAYPTKRVINGNGQMKIKQDLFLVGDRYLYFK